MRFTLMSVMLGIGATLVMDIWALALKYGFGVPSLNYALVGRWIGWMARGRICHQPIMASSAIAGEAALGWGAHYAIGIGLAAVFLALVGPSWPDAPQILPALMFGLTSVVLPFFIMQPAFGFGFAAGKTPAPKTARLRSVMTHLVFGLGLYLSGLILMWGR